MQTQSGDMHNNSTDGSTAADAACYAAADDASTATMVLTVWAGEWPYVKQGVCDARVALTSAYMTLRRRLDVSAYTSRVRAYGDAVDARLARASAQVQCYMQQHGAWLLPAVAMASCSVFVATRSAPWGAYAMARNGMLTCAALLTLCYPQEVLRRVDALSPFSVAHVDNKPRL